MSLLTSDNGLQFIQCSSNANLIVDGGFQKLLSQFKLKPEASQRLQFESVGVFVLAPEIGKSGYDDFAGKGNLTQFVEAKDLRVNDKRF